MIAKILIMTVKIMTILNQKENKKLKLWHKKSNYLKSHSSDFSLFKVKNCNKTKMKLWPKSQNCDILRHNYGIKSQNDDMKGQITKKVIFFTFHVIIIINQHVCVCCECSRSDVKCVVDLRISSCGFCAVRAGWEEEGTGPRLGRSRDEGKPEGMRSTGPHTADTHTHTGDIQSWFTNTEKEKHDIRTL